MESKSEMQEIVQELKELKEQVRAVEYKVNNKSDMRTGTIATVRKGSKEYGVALSELQVPKKIKTNKWFEMYEYWKQGG